MLFYPICGLVICNACVVQTVAPNYCIMKRGVIANVFPFNISSFLVSKSEPTLLVFLSWAEFVQYGNSFIVANTIVAVERLQTQDDTTELSPSQAW